MHRIFLQLSLLWMANVAMAGSFGPMPDRYYRHPRESGEVDSHLKCNISAKTSAGVTRFDAHADASVASIALQNDGKLLASGTFGHIGGQTRAHLVRLSLPDAAPLAFCVGIATWKRGGTAPELNQAPELETSADGRVWTSYGTLQRVLGGWQSQVLHLPLGQAFNRHARGRTAADSAIGTSPGPIEITREFFVD